MKTEYADYSNCSAESVENSIREMLMEVQEKTGASKEQVLQALSIAAQKFMDVNFFINA